MKALSIIPGTKDLYLRDVAEPKITTGSQIKLKVHKVGICGTDREETHGGRADPPNGEKELIIGHEMIGEVVEVGSSIKNIHVGDFGLFTVRRGCDQCVACQSDHYDMCYTGNYKERGIKNMHGFQSEFVVDEEKFFIKVPTLLKDLGVLSEPTSVVAKAIDESCRIQLGRLPSYRNKNKWLEGKTCLVAGLGPIGLLGAMILSLHGCHVLGLDVVDENSARPLILKEMGGTYINAKSVSLGTLSKVHGNIDLILEAAGIAKLDFDLISALGNNGIYVLTGVPAEGSPLSVNGSKLMKQLVLKNQVIFGSVNAGFDHFKMAVNYLESALKKWPNTIPKILSHRVPLKKYKDVFFTHSADEIKVCIDWESS